MHNSKDLGIRNHCVVFPSDVEIALIELSISPSGDGRLIPPIHLTYVESLYFLNIGVVGHEPCEGYGQVIPQRTDFASLILQVIYQLRILAVFACQDFLQLKNRSVYFDGSVLFEDIGYSVDHLSSDCHLVRVEVSSALGRFHLELDLGSLFFFGILLLVLVLLDEAEGVLGFEQERDFLFGRFEHRRLGFDGGSEGVLAAEK